MRRAPSGLKNAENAAGTDSARAAVCNNRCMAVNTDLLADANLSISSRAREGIVSTTDITGIGSKASF